MEAQRRIFYQSLSYLAGAGPDGEAALSFCLAELRALRDRAACTAEPAAHWCQWARVWVIVAPDRSGTVIE